KTAELRGLDGRAVREIDLNRDLGIPDSLVPSLKIGAGTLKAESKGTAPLEKLGPVSREEVARIAAMEPGRRGTALRSIAAARALAEVLAEAQAAERALESAELLATPEVRRELERRRQQLRNELARLAETFGAERRVNAAIGEAQAAAAAEVAEKARERLAPRRGEEARKAAAGQLKPWGCEVKRDERSPR